MLRLNPQEKVARDRRLKKEEWRKMHVEKIGMTRVFEALSKACRGELKMVGGLDDEYTEFLRSGSVDEEGWSEKDGDGQTSEGSSPSTANARIGQSSTLSPSTKRSKSSTRKGRRVPIVVHNGLMDLLFLLTHFHSHTLPPTHDQTKSLIHHYFPIIYDTKVLSSECSDGDIRSESTALGDLYSKNCLTLRQAGDPTPHHHHGLNGNAIQHHMNPDPDPDPVPAPADRDTVLRRVIIVNEDVDDSTQMHEAAHDAFMTGTVFQFLCRRIMRNVEGGMLGDGHLFSGGVWGGNEECVVGGGGGGRKARVGSLSFIDENHPHSDMSFLFGQNKV